MALSIRVDMITRTMWFRENLGSVLGCPRGSLFGVDIRTPDFWKLPHWAFRPPPTKSQKV